jgi:formylglycine-generating enzyme
MRIGLLALLLPAAGGFSGCAPTRAAAPPPPGMVRIPGGVFRMGTGTGFAYEGPVHEVSLKPFYMDAHEVTNRRFAEFVQATGHRTVSEAFGMSGVHDPAKREWVGVKGASWRHPTGPKSTVDGKDDYPVVHISYTDAQAYARWAGKRLPTEAEWEFAARGGQPEKKYPWGDELNPGGKYMANYWQDTFPKKDLAKDGFAGAAPAGSFPANGYGLYDMSGNVWEWVADRFSATYFQASLFENPAGPPEGDEFVIRGGSFLCAENWCAGYRAAARNKNKAEDANFHMGFRCAGDIR